MESSDEGCLRTPGLGRRYGRIMIERIGTGWNQGSSEFVLYEIRPTNTPNTPRKEGSDQKTRIDSCRQHGKGISIKRNRIPFEEAA
jgi:hypothetical protein